MALSIDQKRLKATKFPPEFDKKVDIEKVNIDLMKKWIANKITTILGDEDDIVVETCYNLVEQNKFVRQQLRMELQAVLTCAAQNQGDSDPAHGFLEQRNSCVLQRAMGPDAERARQPGGCAKGTVGGEETRAAGRTGEAYNYGKVLTVLIVRVVVQAAAEARLREQKEQDDMIDSFRRNDRPERPERPERHERGRGGGNFRGGDRRGRGRDYDRGPPRHGSRSPPFVTPQSEKCYY